MYRLLLGVVLLLFVACSSEEPVTVGTGSAKKAAPPGGAPGGAVEEQAPKAVTGHALRITPAEASMGTKLKLLAVGFRLEEARVNWLVDDAEVSTLDEYVFDVSGEGARKGETIRAVAKVGDVEVLSNTVRVVNSLPKLTSVKIMPEVFRPGDKVRVDAEAEDPDSDMVDILYEWTHNGASAGAGSRLEVQLKRGDVFTVRIIPSDGEGHGRPILLHREVGNMPPVFEESGDFHFIGQEYSFQPRVYDPDGDDISFSLKAGPEGMAVHNATGLVKWVVPADFSGMQPFTLSAADGHGGEARKTYKLTFTFDGGKTGEGTAPAEEGKTPAKETETPGT
jgi:hypothetical protein